uniref:Uncharacterized protein n=1 Tax=viral metagenome TaxID=1070528 RepID=A0A6C0JWM4_9ZZZZ
MFDHLNTLASSPFVLGIFLLIVNIGSRYITHELSADDDEYSQNILFRRVAIFAACFVGTRDLVVSFLLTAAFVVIAGGLFRGKGPFSKEGMQNKDIRASAGLLSVDHPAYSEEKPMFT